MNEPAAASAAGGRRLAYLLVVLIAVATRSLGFAHAASSPFLSQPILDELWYTTAADALARGLPVADPGFRPLLYPALLALVGVPSLAGTLTVLLVQHLLGVATALLVGGLAARLCSGNPLAIVAAGGLWSCAGPPLGLEAQLLGEAAFGPLLMVLVWLLARVPDRGMEALPREVALRAAGFGVVLAMAAMIRPNAAILVVAPLVLLLGLRWPWRPAAAAGAATAGAFAASLGLAALVLASTGHPAHPLGTAGGVNLYLGMARTADGMVPRQGGTVFYAEEYRDSIAAWSHHAWLEREQPSDPQPSPRALSRYWTISALEEVRADPLGRAWLCLRKLGFLLWNEEIPNHLSWAFMAAHTPLGFLPVRFSWLIALAPVGFLAVTGSSAARSTRSALLLVCGLLALAILPFFVADRYRLPLWAPLAAAAGVGLVDLGQRLRRREWRAVSTRLILAGAIFTLSSGPWLGAELPHLGRDHYFRSIAALSAGDLELAARDAAAAAELEPSPAIDLQRALVDLAAGSPGTALAHARTGLRRFPLDPRLQHAAATALDRLGHTAEAYQLWSAVAPLVDHPASLTNLAILELRAGLVERARFHLGRVPVALGSAASGATVWQLVAAAELARRDGDSLRAAALEAEAEKIDVRAAQAARADLAVPLEPRDLGLVPDGSS